MHLDFTNSPSLKERVSKIPITLVQERHSLFFHSRDVCILDGVFRWVTYMHTSRGIEIRLTVILDWSKFVEKKRPDKCEETKTKGKQTYLLK